MGNNKGRRILLGYSGGLDTSFCIPYYTRECKSRVIAAIVDTGGIDDVERADLERRALALGAEQFFCLDGRAALVDRVLRFLIAGNIRRGGTYPLCVSAERAIQAEMLVGLARQMGCDAIAHGSTGAGNDQIRFEVAIRALAPEIEPLAPVRELGLSREEEKARLEGWGLARHVRAPSGSAYSINRGLWGTSIGGKQTSTSDLPLPEEAFVVTVAPASAPSTPLVLRISFAGGMPVALNGVELDGVTLIRELETLAARNGVGRGMHLGDTIIGIKGRVAYEAPAAEVLLTAHRELEKLVLTREQQRLKDQVAAVYGDLVHEAKFFDPAARDAEALLASSQQTVSGDVTVELFKGNVRVLGCSSPFSFMAVSGARYGEKTAGYSGRDAAGFSALLGNSARIAALARSTLAGKPGAMPARTQTPAQSAVRQGKRPAKKKRK